MGSYKQQMAYVFAAIAAIVLGYTLYTIHTKKGVSYDTAGARTLTSNAAKSGAKEDKVTDAKEPTTGDVPTTASVNGTMDGAPFVVRAPSSKKSEKAMTINLVEQCRLAYGEGHRRLAQYPYLTMYTENELDELAESIELIKNDREGFEKTCNDFFEKKSFLPYDNYQDARKNLEDAKADMDLKIAASKEPQSMSDRLTTLGNLKQAYSGLLSAFEQGAMKAALLSQSSPKHVGFSKNANAAKKKFMAVKESFHAPLGRIDMERNAIMNEMHSNGGHRFRI